MKRALLQIPEGLTFDMLSEEQQAAINSVFGQYVLPTPGTIPFKGMVVCDALTGDNFDPKVMAAYGIDWPILFLGQWDGKSDSYNEVLIPLNEEVYFGHMPEGMTPEGDPIPPIIAEHHRWSGWPPMWKELN